VILRMVEQLPDQPEGNHFRTPAELDYLLSTARFTVVSSAELSDFPAPEPDWQAAVDRVEAVIEAKHRGDDRWQVAQQQEQLIGQLIKEQLVIGRLMVLRPAS
jgi:sugar phosphate isomerase/epimerase